MVKTIELPENAILFNTEQDWKKLPEQSRYYITGSPDKYPCIGWCVDEYDKPNTWKSTQIWTFVYPATSLRHSTYEQWLNDLGLTDENLNKILAELERLEHRDSKTPERADEWYFHGRVDAFNAIWKLFMGLYDSTDYCLSDLGK